MDMPQKNRILVVGESRMAKDCVKAMLTREEYEINIVDSPFGASSEILKRKPDLVLIDTDMPALSGDKIVRIVRRHPDLGNTRMVLISDGAGGELAQKARDCGADGFIRNTDDPLKILRKLEQCIAR